MSIDIESYLNQHPDLGELVEEDLTGVKTGFCLDCYYNYISNVPSFLTKSDKTELKKVFCSTKLMEDEMSFIDWQKWKTLLTEYCLPSIHYSLEKGASVFLYGKAPEVFYSLLAFKLGIRSKECTLLMHRNCSDKVGYYRYTVEELQQKNTVIKAAVAVVNEKQLSLPVTEVSRANRIYCTVIISMDIGFLSKFQFRPGDYLGYKRYRYFCSPNLPLEDNIRFILSSLQSIMLEESCTNMVVYIQNLHPVLAYILGMIAYEFTNTCKITFISPCVPYDSTSFIRVFSNGTPVRVSSQKRPEDATNSD